MIKRPVKRLWGSDDEPSTCIMEGSIGVPLTSSHDTNTDFLDQLPLSNSVQSVCYGALNHAAAAYLEKRGTPEASCLTPCSEFYRFPVKANGSHFVLQNNASEEFAVLDTRTIDKLAALEGLPSIYFEALCPVSEFSKRRSKGQRQGRSFPVSINVFGPQDAAGEVGARLSRVSGLLQHPKTLHESIQYDNPQYLRFPNEDLDMKDFIGFGGKPSEDKQTKVSAEINDILNSLTTVKADSFSLPDGLLSSLKPNTPHARCYGGIIADVMGLGKTLTMLTSILHSLPSADRHGMFYQDDIHQMCNQIPTRATLVVVTSALADIDGLGVLAGMNWYRIVLDEAHWIRNSSSEQFRALSSLTTNRRWCVTGTPIQNKLDELASLASFLKLPPCFTKASFQSKILAPLSQGGPDYAKPLRTYLRSYCLRRTAHYLNLPESSEEVIHLDLSPEEQGLYEGILTRSRREIDGIVSAVNNIKRYNVLFTAILKMRMLCNRGTLPALGTSSYLSPQNQAAKCERCSDISEDDAGPRSGDETASHTSSGQDRANMKYSIVFSYWTSTLDVLQKLLNAAGVSNTRIDGRTSYVERSNRLNTFRQDPRVTVLLMSIETGAVGLNLTAANTVHIVEPQWNPSVEEQAVARALRMGQTKKVKIFRYIMKGTVEENIVQLQKKKKTMATFTFGGDNGDNIQERLEDLKFILNTNPEEGNAAMGATSWQSACG
ncbi:hypothetical protein FZEAL_3133 [Fusarium zealandicum]|uniref:Helicase n=1 Tax=Fusarium zealandicum TaxID=1053134 RepID=A0A8H4UPF6_9HYPO|nr:hypothetical protein FZEAL_3133 [Fusarium zealandicum]